MLSPWIRFGDPKLEAVLLFYGVETSPKTIGVSFFPTFSDFGEHLGYVWVQVGVRADLPALLQERFKRRPRRKIL